MSESKLGATGKFPDGKLNEDDEGELMMAVAADHKKGLVLMDFGTPVKWAALPPSNAKEFARALIAKAEELEAMNG